MERPIPPPFAFYLCGCTATKAAVSAETGSARPLPDTLVIPPGIYSVHGQTYDAREQGLYRFFRPMHDNQQRIVYRDDLYSLMSAVCWMHSHGSRDDCRSFKKVARIGLTGKLILSCGPYSSFISKLFGQLGVRLRIVFVKTLLDRNGYNDGHVLTEIFLDGRWVVFDVDPHRMYCYAGERLSLLDLVPHVQADDYAEEPLAQSMPLAIGHFSDRESKYDYGLWYEAALGYADPRAEFRRWMMIPGISDAGKDWYTTYSEPDHRRAKRMYADLHYLQYLPMAEFRARFYSEGS